MNLEEKLRDLRSKRKTTCRAFEDAQMGEWKDSLETEVMLLDRMIRELEAMQTEDQKRSE